MKKLNVILISVLILTSCKSDKSELFDKLLVESKNSTQIKLDQLTTFDWDKIYIFNSGISLLEINEKLGTEIEGLEEFAIRMVFLHNNEVVNYQKKPVSSSGADGFPLSFKFPENQRTYMELERHEATFQVESSLIDGIKYFSLTLVSRD